METVADELKNGAWKLKSVPDQLISKNRTDKCSVVPVKAKSDARAPFLIKAGDPSINREKDVWFVKNHTQIQGVVSLPPDCNDSSEKAYVKQSVSIVDSQEATFKLEPIKMNSLMIESSRNVNIVVNTLISSIQISNCAKIKLQILGVVPFITIDQSTGVDIYLSKESLAAEIATSKSGEMHLNIPDKEEGEWIEIPIPEQFVHKLDGDSKLLTEVSKLYSS